MPTYEYACRSCNHRFEKWQKMSEQPLTTCPACGGPIHRVFYPAGIVFKGSGFYKTDHAGSAAAPASNGAKEPAATTEKSETKSAGESKAAASTSASTSTTAESKAS